MSGPDAEGTAPTPEPAAPGTPAAGTVTVPDRGVWIVSDGRVIPAHKVRKEADYLLNYCPPDDPCGAEDGCNT